MMHTVLQILLDQWLFDVAQFSKPWVYWTVLPCLFYLMFFVMKWFVLTLPLWLPIVIITSSFNKNHD